MTLLAAGEIGHGRPISTAELSDRLGRDPSTCKRDIAALRRKSYCDARRSRYGLVITVRPVMAWAWRELHGERIILEHQSLVKDLARRAGARLPYWIPLDDLEQTAQLGLLAALEKYRPELGIPFAAFARMRIYGAVIDANRRANYLFEMHQELPWEAFRNREGNSDGYQPRVIDRHRRVADLPASDDMERVEDGIEQQQQRAVLEEALGSLSPRDQSLLGSYLNGKELKELGVEQGVTVSSVSTRRKAAIGRLRAELEFMGYGKADLL